jgi:ubiquinone/menaquinone biosynthesis C-methylase UbiE
MRRQSIPELLDSDAGMPAEIAASLEDLRWFNRHFGGLSTTASLLLRVAKRLGFPPVLSYLDVAGASADGIAHAAPHLRAHGTDLRVIVMDRSRMHLADDGARQSAIRICGDALALPFAEASFDVVGSSLFLHHLEPQEVVRFYGDALRVCRYAVIANDLVRSRWHHGLALAGRPFYRSRLTRHDAPVSVLRAYTVHEMYSLLKQSQASSIEMSRHYLFRFGAVVWK